MPATSVRALTDEVERVSARLRGMSDVRLGQPLPDGATRVAAARQLAQSLADAAQGIEQRELENSPRPRVVPDLGVFAVGDQMAVTGADLVRVADTVPEDTMVWHGCARASVDEVIQAQAAAVRALRLSL